MPQDEEIGTAQRLLRNLARDRFLTRKNSSALTESDLNEIASAVSRYNFSSSLDDDDYIDALQRNDTTGDERQGIRFNGYINYDEFCSLRDSVNDRLKEFFDVDTFTKFRRNATGCISTHLLLRYIYRRVFLFQIRLQLSWYDTHGENFLYEQDLESYFYELIPNLKALADLQENFYQFYVFTSVRKFFFFLDPKKSGRISITDLLTSPILHELIDLQKNSEEIGNPGSDSSGNRDDHGNALNWFSADNTLRVYNQYLELDIDHNGMLSRLEMAGYGTGTLTSMIIDRIFDECLTYEGEIDYITFVDFALAMETKKAPQSLAYFFRLLDVQKKGFLDRFTINCFFREIIKRLRELHGGMMGTMICTDDVIDEIFDMCKPKNPSHITLDDLVRCGVGDTIVSILIDISGFWAYDNREYMISEDSQEENDVEEVQLSSESPMI